MHKNTYNVCLIFRLPHTQVKSSMSLWQYIFARVDLYYRWELLLAGKPWKTKKKDQVVKDNNCTNLRLKLINKEITEKRYLNVVVKIMGNCK